MTLWAVPSKRLDWRVWLTGASSGLGEALARELARRGARIALFARREERLARLSSELTATGAVDVLVQVGDVTNHSRVAEAVRQVEERWSGVDVAILNAGISDMLPGHRFRSEPVEAMFSVNVLGAAYGIEAVLPGMLERGHGIIVGISSISAARGLPMAAPYCASKAALTTLLESLRLDLAPHGVRVITVSPGFIRTPMTDRNRFPMPFLQSPEQAARRILRGVVRGARTIHFPWRLTVPVYGLRLLPARLYDALFRRLVAGQHFRKLPSDPDSGSSHAQESR